MKKTLNQLFFILLSCSFLLLLLIYSKECITLASKGLLIWYQNMIPTLFPFMVLSGFLVRTKISYRIGHLLQPFLGILLPLPSHMLYVVFMGFLCGFPMGAKIVADMMEKEQLSKKEGQYLLSFCNNIGPLYMIGYVIPLFQFNKPWLILLLMYSIPILFGLFSYIRIFMHFNINLNHKQNMNQKLIISNNEKEIMKSEYLPRAINCVKKDSYNYLSCFQESLSSALEQITLLGGCMVFFNTLLIIPIKLLSLISFLQPFAHIKNLQGIFCSFVEIGGGLQQLATQNSITLLSPYILISLLTFGGLSCMIQTFFIIKNTGLNIFTYLKHKTIQSCIYIFLYIIFNS